MKSFRVILDDSVQPQDIHRLISAVEQMKGVRQIDSLNMPQSGMPDQQPVGDQNFYRAPQPPQDSHYDVPPQGRPQQMPLSESSQRKFISASIKWGVRNQKVQLEKISQMTPEETVHLAMKLAEMMPEEEKQKLADQIQNS